MLAAYLVGQPVSEVLSADTFVSAIDRRALRHPTGQLVTGQLLKQFGRLDVSVVNNWVVVRGRYNIKRFLI
jgi:hypothetical protein